MPKIIDNNNKEIGMMTVIAKYFKHATESTQEFMAGCKGLTDADKLELAVGAAKNLGFTVTE